MESLERSSCYDRPSRRGFLTISAAALFAGAAHRPAFSATENVSSVGTTKLRLAAASAWIWGLPLIEAAEQRAARYAEGAKPNSFQHQRMLVTVKGQQFTAPNNDTLYSQAWLDLDKGPVIVNIPASGRRYYCVPLMDMYTNNFAIISSRTAGGNAQTFSVVGPNETARIPGAIRAPTNSVWVLGRTLIDGEVDLPQAHAFQDGWKITGPQAEMPKRYPTRHASWDEYFGAVQALMNENPPPATDARMLEEISPLLQFGRRFDASRFSPQEISEIKAGIGDFGARVLRIRRSTLNSNGWSYPRYSMGDFGQDYDYRAAVAVSGLGALPRVEAMYLRASGPDAKGYDSSKSWRLTFAADQLPPVDSFWSLSMYRLTPDGALFFSENSIDRYTIGDRTAGLKRGADGSIEIIMSRSEPMAQTALNWLPPPADGNFVPILRAYLPRSNLLDGTYVLPAIRPI